MIAWPIRGWCAINLRHHPMNPITVLNKSNAPTGPFTRAQIAEKLQGGEMALTDLAFVEGIGLSQWTPLRDVLARVDGTGAVLPAPPVIAPPAVAAPAYSYAATMEPPSHLVYAGFWLRFVAIFLDGLIVGIPMMIVGAIIGGIVGFTYGYSHPGTKFTFIDSDGSLNGTFVAMEVGIMILSITVKWLYFALQESSSAQATLGKRVMGLRVTSLEGRRIGFGQASGRFFAKIVSGMTLLIGYLMAGFTERKQALHDMIAGTLVVRQ
jgi:uncharacterized RDD family membrane protein YckC